MSTKQNQHVEDYLDAYLKMDDVDFAVMITGAWGCGKTYFIKDYLDRVCTDGDQKNYIYISLNGVCST
ncbi:MAG: P-loop NTPase fold protein, partial [Desulfuromusa sp.]|nr:P-loop NTPase fold protein [Desulfuromusa sp.]